MCQVLRRIARSDRDTHILARPRLRLAICSLQDRRESGPLVFVDLAWRDPEKEKKHRVHSCPAVCKCKDKHTYKHAHTRTHTLPQVLCKHTQSFWAGTSNRKLTVLCDTMECSRELQPSSADLHPTTIPLFVLPFPQNLSSLLKCRWCSATYMFFLSAVIITKNEVTVP